MNGNSDEIAGWPGGTPGPDAVRRVLEGVLASEMFRGSAKLAAFLRFVVEATLRGEQDRIKGYTIGVEALGREESFDPQIDPIVRVEATRLRRTLDRYYAGPGADDAIIFELTRGSYVPNFRVRRPGGSEAAAEPENHVPKSRHLGIFLAALAAVLIFAAGAVALTRYLEQGNRTVAEPGRDANRTFNGPLQAGNGMPTLAIPHISILGLPPQPGAPRPQLLFASTLTEKLRTAIARFDTLNVADPTQESGGPGPALSAKPEASADYHLLGSGEFQEDGSANVRFRLLDGAAGNVVWSRTLGPFASATDYGPAEDLIVYQLATTLAPPFGVIRALERVRQLAGGARDPRYRCILEASESFRTFDPAQHARARACLETLTARDPGYAMGFAYLAAVYAREYQYLLGGGPGDPHLLDWALRAARRGVELSPESARAYQMLFTVLFIRRDTAAAFAAGDKALALNPLDMTILSDYGGRLVVAGEIDRGMDALKRAADDGVVRASWYHFYLFLGSYLRNDRENAAHHANQIAIDARPLGLLARTLVAAANGNREGARGAYDQLIAARPGWRERPKEQLARLLPASPVVDRIVHDLAAAGLVPAD